MKVKNAAIIIGIPARRLPSTSHRYQKPRKQVHGLSSDFVVSEGDDNNDSKVAPDEFELTHTELFLIFRFWLIGMLQPRR